MEEEEEQMADDAETPAQITCSSDLQHSTCDTNTGYSISSSDCNTTARVMTSKPGIIISTSPTLNAHHDAATSVTFSKHSGRKRVAMKHDGFVDTDEVITKRQRTSSPQKQVNYQGITTKTRSDSQEERLSPLNSNNHIEQANNVDNSGSVYDFSESCGSVGDNNAYSVANNSLPHGKFTEVGMIDSSPHRIASDCDSPMGNEPAPPSGYTRYTFTQDCTFERLVRH